MKGAHLQPGEVVNKNSADDDPGELKSGGGKSVKLARREKRSERQFGETCRELDHLEPASYQSR